MRTSGFHFGWERVRQQRVRTSQQFVTTKKRQLPAVSEQYVGKYARPPEKNRAVSFDAKKLKNDKRNVGKRERRVELRGKTKAMKDKK